MVEQPTHELTRNLSAAVTATITSAWHRSESMRTRFTSLKACTAYCAAIISGREPVKVGLGADRHEAELMAFIGKCADTRSARARITLNQPATIGIDIK